MSEVSGEGTVKVDVLEDHRAYFDGEIRFTGLTLTSEHEVGSVKLGCLSSILVKTHTDTAHIDLCTLAGSDVGGIRGESEAFCNHRVLIEVVCFPTFKIEYLTFGKTHVVCEVTDNGVKRRSVVGHSTGDGVFRPDLVLDEDSSPGAP